MIESFVAASFEFVVALLGRTFFGAINLVKRKKVTLSDGAYEITGFVILIAIFFTFIFYWSM